MYSYSPECVEVVFFEVLPLLAIQAAKVRSLRDASLPPKSKIHT
jgi:hypothetical protein